MWRGVGQHADSALSLARLTTRRTRHDTLPMRRSRRKIGSRQMLATERDRRRRPGRSGNCKRQRSGSGPVLHRGASTASSNTRSSTPQSRPPRRRIKGKSKDSSASISHRLEGRSLTKDVDRFHLNAVLIWTSRGSALETIPYSQVTCIHCHVVNDIKSHSTRISSTAQSSRCTSGC